VRNHQLQVALRDGQTKLKRLQVNLHEHGRTIERLKEEVRELDEQLHDQRQVSEELRAALAQKEDDLRQSLERVRPRPFESTAGPLQQPMRPRRLALWVPARNSTAASWRSSGGCWRRSSGRPRSAAAGPVKIAAQTWRLTPHAPSSAPRRRVRSQTLLKVKMNQDLLVDGSLLVAAYWLVNMALVDVPLTWLSAAASGRSTPRRRWTRQLAKLAIMTAIFLTAREQAKSYGLHSNVGTLVPYLQYALGLLWPSKVSPPLPPPPPLPTADAAAES